METSRPKISFMTSENLAVICFEEVIRMPTYANLITFAFVALGMVITPGPNMIYLISRSIIQGRMAGLISLGGGGIVKKKNMFYAALGITALVFAVPYAYDT